MSTSNSFFSDLFQNVSADEVFLFTLLATYVGFILLIILIFIIDYFLQSIALYRMASLAGFDRPWLGFIPFARQYIAVNLPYKKFNCCGLYKTYNRDNAFKWYIILKVAPFLLAFAYIGMYALFAVFSVIPVIGTLFVTFISMILSAVFNLVTYAVGGANILYNWAVRSDLLDVYNTPKSSRILILIFSTALRIPFVYSIALLMHSGREPRFGFGNYYEPDQKILFEEGYESEYSDEIEDENWVQISDDPYQS